MSLTGTIRLDGAADWTRAPSQAQLLLRCNPAERITRLSNSRQVLREWTSPLDALHWMSTEAREHEWIGFLSYDLGREFEALPASADDDLKLPAFVFTAHNGTGVSSPLKWEPSRVSQSVRSTFRRDEYEMAVRKCLDYIRAGDVFQINLSQRFTAPLLQSPGMIYERLLHAAPARYGAFLEYEDFSLLCNSPELFLHVSPDRRIITRPIKGTRPRSPGMEKELLDSPKDQAELNMIVDLERNDLGRVCEIGSVRVAEPRRIESHPTVLHGVATIEGRLRDDVSFVDLLRATFPGGSITGAPKIRAMQIIEELEPVRRGAYCGAIGRLSPDGSMQFNVAIRTMTAKDGLIHIPVGGGIVADSEPAAEYEETLVKAAAMFGAVGIEGNE